MDNVNNNEDGDDAAFVDSFFLPGGILDEPINIDGDDGIGECKQNSSKQRSRFGFDNPSHEEIYGVVTGSSLLNNNEMNGSVTKKNPWLASERIRKVAPKQVLWEEEQQQKMAGLTSSTGKYHENESFFESEPAIPHQKTYASSLSYDEARNQNLLTPGENFSSKKKEDVALPISFCNNGTLIGNRSYNGGLESLLLEAKSDQQILPGQSIINGPLHQTNHTDLLPGFQFQSQQPCRRDTVDIRGKTIQQDQHLLSTDKLGLALNELQATDYQSNRGISREGIGVNNERPASSKATLNSVSAADRPRPRPPPGFEEADVAPTAAINSNLPGTNRKAKSKKKKQRQRQKQRQKQALSKKNSESTRNNRSDPIGSGLPLEMLHTPVCSESNSIVASEMSSLSESSCGLGDTRVLTSPGNGGNDEKEEGQNNNGESNDDSNKTEKLYVEETTEQLKLQNEERHPMPTIDTLADDTGKDELEGISSKCQVLPSNDSYSTPNKCTPDTYDSPPLIEDCRTEFSLSHYFYSAYDATTTFLRKQIDNAECMVKSKTETVRKTLYVVIDRCFGQKKRGIVSTGKRKDQSTKETSASYWFKMKEILNPLQPSSVAFDKIRNYVKEIRSTLLSSIQNAIELREFAYQYVGRAYLYCRLLATISVRAVLVAVYFIILLCRHAFAELCEGGVATSCFVTMYSMPSLLSILMNNMKLPYWTPHLLSCAMLYRLCRPMKKITLLSRTDMKTSSGDDDDSPRRTKGRGNTPRKAENSRTKANDTKDKYVRKVNDHSNHSTNDIISLQVLAIARSMIPLMFIRDGFAKEIGSIMRMSASSRLILAFVLCLFRIRVPLSIIGWLSWSIQVLVVKYCPAGAPIETFLLALGPATIRLIRFLELSNSIDGQAHPSEIKDYFQSRKSQKT